MLVNSYVLTNVFSHKLVPGELFSGILFHPLHLGTLHHLLKWALSTVSCIYGYVHAMVAMAMANIYTSPPKIVIFLPCYFPSSTRDN